VFVPLWPWCPSWWSERLWRHGALRHFFPSSTGEPLLVKDLLKDLLVSLYDAVNIKLPGFFQAGLAEG
jgi:hypothetical protein